MPLAHAKLNYLDLTTNHLPNGSATVLYLSASIASCSTDRCLQPTLCSSHHRRIASLWREMAFTNLRFEPILPPSARDEGAAASEHQVGHIAASAHTSKNRKAYKVSASKIHCRASESHIGPLLYQNTGTRSHRAQRPRTNRIFIKSPEPIQSGQTEPQVQQESGNRDNP